MKRVSAITPEEKFQIEAFKVIKNELKISSFSSRTLNNPDEVIRLSNKFKILENNNIEMDSRGVSEIVKDGNMAPSMERN